MQGSKTMTQLKFIFVEKNNIEILHEAIISMHDDDIQFVATTKSSVIKATVSIHFRTRNYHLCYASKNYQSFPSRERIMYFSAFFLNHTQKPAEWRKRSLNETWQVHWFF